MKKTLFKIFLFTALLIGWSCEEESNMDPVGDWDLSAPVPQAPAASENVVLDESIPDEEVKFEWLPAVASNQFIVQYTVYLVDADATDASDPILVLTPGNSGKDLSVATTAKEIDYALWARCYPAGANANVKWMVKGKAIETEATGANAITIKRFDNDHAIEQMFITGGATEGGAAAESATPMRALKNADGELTGVFDVYTRLTAGQTYFFRDKALSTSRIYGGADGTLAACGAPITAPEDGVYRVRIDLNANTYDLWLVDRWSLVGDAVEGGWGGDVPLTYKGNGVFEGPIDFLSDGAGWIFRANGDWGYIIKRIKDTASPEGLSGQVYMESEAEAAGIEIEDLRIEGSGIHTVTLDLSANAYTFTIVPAPVDPGDNAAIIGKSSDPTADVVSGNFLFGTYDAPEELYLVSNGVMVGQLTKEGNVFTSKYLALEQSKQYILNSASDGSGTTYNDIDDGTIAVDHDQAYQLEVDFDEGKVNWKHYNLKLFHWDELGGGWDARNEYPTTYVHPYKFEAQGVALSAGFSSKFISPWDVQFGTASAALSGTMTNGGPNYFGIVQNGNYNATITITDDYTTGTYSFVKQ
jgi:starch-binding outer membrane protein SusE/F